MNELLEFQNYTDKGFAELNAEILKKNGIEVEIVENPPLLDSNFIGQQFHNPFSLKIPGDSFLLADKILMEQTKVNMEEVDKEYILFSLSNEELMDVLKDKETWGIYNYKLASQILAERNNSTPEAEQQKVLQLNLDPDAQPKDTGMFWIFLTYICIAFSILSLFRKTSFVLFLFPQLFYIVFGYTLYSTKTILRNGTRIYSYTKKTRIHGLIILSFGIVFLLVLLAIIFKIIPLWNQ